MSAAIPTPYHVFFPHTEVDRMLHKVRDTRLAPEPILPDPNLGWTYGLDHTWFKELNEYWQEEWNWEDVQKEINKFPHFRVPIEDLTIHFIHVKSTRPDAIPLILVHGWPSTFLEFAKVIDPLVNPNEGEQAYDVIVPSLPGYTFSSPPQRAWTSDDTARVFNSLMVDVLGYKTYGAVGGDLGTRVLTSLLYNHPSSVLVAHYTMLYGSPPPSLIATLLEYVPVVGKAMKEWWEMRGVTEEERKALESQKRFVETGGGYKALQQTRPATIGASLYDNPVGILAYIGDKYHEWADPNTPHPPSHIITTAALYHLTGCITTSFLPYRDYSPSPLFPSSYHLATPSTTQTSIPTAQITSAPIGYSSFASDIQAHPRAWLEGNGVRNLVGFRMEGKGGHFNALENEGAWVRGVRGTMRGENFSRA